MAHIFSFAILKAIPDPKRGERVNVGIVVFKPDGSDIRIPEVGKLRALHDGNWSDYLENVRIKWLGFFRPETNHCTSCIVLRFSRMSCASRMWRRFLLMSRANTRAE